jgi:hypothetical protein
MIMLCADVIALLSRKDQKYTFYLATISLSQKTHQSNYQEFSLSDVAIPHPAILAQRIHFISASEVKMASPLNLVHIHHHFHRHHSRSLDASSQVYIQRRCQVRLFSDSKAQSQAKASDTLRWAYKLSNNRQWPIQSSGERGGSD